MLPLWIPHPNPFCGFVCTFAWCVVSVASVCVWYVASVVCCSCCMTRHTAFCDNSHGCMCQFTWLHGSLIPWGRKDPFPLHGSVFGKAKTGTGSHLIRWLRGSMTLWGLPWLKMLKGPVRATMTCGPLKVPNQGSESEEHSCSTYSSSASGGGRSSWSSSCGTSSWMRHMSSEVVATAVCWQIPRPVEWCCLFLPRNLIGLTQRRFAYHDTCMAKVCKSTMVTCCCKTSNIVQVCTSLQQTLQTPSKLIFCRSLTKKKDAI